MYICSLIFFFYNLVISLPNKQIQYHIGQLAVQLSISINQGLTSIMSVNLFFKSKILLLISLIVYSANSKKYFASSLNHYSTVVFLNSFN